MSNRSNHTPREPRMFRSVCAIGVLLFVFTFALCAYAQQAQGTSTPAASATLPNLVRFSGRAADSNGKPLTGLVGITFALYEQEIGGPALWLETQNVQLDATGHYTSLLGVTKPDGLPAGVFASGQARWVGAQVSGQAEQPRVMLLAVPYAMKAGDAETVGGLPASAFMLAVPDLSAQNSSQQNSASASTLAPALGGTGTTNFLPLWSNSTTLGNSTLFQLGTGTTAKVGFNTTTPGTTLDVNGAATVRGNLGFPATGVATATAGKNSQPLSFTASVFSKSTTTAVNENFRWQAEPVGNNTTTATGSLNLLSAQGTGAYAETGLKIGRSGLVTFATGQTFPGTGAGTITGVTAGTALTGGGTKGSVVLNVDTTKVPLLAAVNTFTGDQTINGSVLASGSVYGQSAGFAGNLSGSLVSVNQSSASGSAIQATSSGVGVEVNSSDIGVYSVSDNGTSIYGLTNTNSGGGVVGDTTGAGSWGVWATNRSSSGQALWAETTASGSANGAGPDGAHGVSHASGGAGVAGINDASGGIGVYGRQLISGSFAGRFDGDVWVNGNLSKNGGSFKIDHPLEPTEKYLYHSFVESPDMKNIYDGVATLDASGEAVVQMPDWFGALNRDFRYQLTCIGGFAPVYVAGELANNQFRIGGGRAGMRVSWQITGTRQDAWANAHRIPVEETKPEGERGTYLNPEVFGKPKQSGLLWRRFGDLETPRVRRMPKLPLRPSTKAKVQTTSGTGD